MGPLLMGVVSFAWGGEGATPNPPCQFFVKTQYSLKFIFYITMGIFLKW